MSVSSKPTCRVVRPRDTYAGKQGFSVTDVLPPVVLAALICDRLSMDEQREFLHGEYIRVSHNQEVWT